MTDTSLWRRAPGRGAGLRGRTSPFLSRDEQTLDALRKERDFSSAVIDTVGALVVVFDTEGGIVEFNRSCEETTGYTFEEVRGRRVWDVLVLPIEVEGVKAAFRELSAGSFPGRYENYWVAKDGQKRLISWQNTALVDSFGDVDFIIGTGIDVTEQRRAEVELRRSEERFRSLVQNSSDILLLLGPDASVTYVSDSVERLGYKADEVIGRIGFDFVHPDDLEGVTEEFSNLIGNPGAIITLEARSRHKDGSWRWVEATLQNLLHDSNLESIVMNMRDVTERKVAAQALVETEATLRALLDQLPIGVVFRDKHGESSEANRAALSLLRAAPEHFIGTSREEFANTFQVSDLDGRRLSPEELPEIRALHEGREIEPSELLFTLGDGSERRFSVGAAPVILYGGELSGSVLVLMDVTDQRATEDRLRQAQKLEAVGQLAGGVAHDFNNLLSVIQNYAQFAMEALPDDHQSREDVEEVMKAGERGAHLIRQLLAFSRKDVAQPVVLNVNDVVTDMERLLKRTLGEHIELAVELESDLSCVRIGSGQLEQIVMNLCVNARDAMPEGGRLVLKTATERREGSSDGGPSIPSGDYVRLTVSDSGRGMSPAVKARMFEPFFTTKERGSGTGLGLATVYGIVEQAGGHISVASEQGTGTDFKVLLPATSRPVTGDVVGDNGVSVGGNGETVLVTEDEAAVRELVRRILSRNGYRVLVAGSGAEAKDVFDQSEGRIDVLLTDVVMPGGSGKELAERLLDADPSIKVLFMSGYDDNIVAEQGVVPEGEELLQKPFATAELLRRMQDVLSDG